MNHTIDWLDRIEQALKEMDESPLFGYGPQLDSEEACQNLASLLQISQLTIKLGEKRWLSHHDFLQGMHATAVFTTLWFSPLEGSAQWVVTDAVRDRILNALLKTPHGQELPDSFKEAAFSFFCLQALQAVESTGFLQDLSPQMQQGAQQESVDGAYAIDITLFIKKEALFSRLLISKELQSNWKAHFSKQTSFQPSDKQLRSLDLLLPVIACKTTLALQQWQKAQVGDLLVLDQMSYDPEIQKGSVWIYLGNRPLFRCRLRDAKLKLLDVPFYYEEEIEMENEQQDAPDYDDTFDEEVQQQTPQEEKLDDRDIDADLAEDGNENEEAEDAGGEQDSPALRLERLKDLPITITLELCKIRMSAQELMALSPGNFLELEQPAGRYVHMTVNGRRVGKGELVKLGDVIGVRITEL